MYARCLNLSVKIKKAIFFYFFIYIPLEGLEKVVKALMKMTTKKMTAEVNFLAIISIVET